MYSSNPFRLKAVCALFLSLSLFSCQTEDNEITEESRRAIAFTPMGWQTRGTQITKSNLTSFGMSCAIYPAESTYETAQCGSYFHNIRVDASTGRTDYYWPGGNYRLSFYGYAPYGAKGITVANETLVGQAYYHYMVPILPKEQSDFMTVNVLDQDGAGSVEPVPLTFTHRCADIRFTCENVGVEEVILKSVSLIGLRFQGILTGSTWNLFTSLNSPTNHPFLLSVEQSIAADETIDVTGTDNHFIMLPQTVESGTQIFDVYATVLGETKHFYHTLSSPLTFEAGKVYTFRLKLSDLLEVDENIDIQDWAEETDRTGIPTYQNDINTAVGIGGWQSE